MRTTVTIQNLKCDACKSNVIHIISKMEGISNVSINIGKSALSFDYKTHNTMEGLRMELAEMGYPITEDPNTIVDKSDNIDVFPVGKLKVS